MEQPDTKLGLFGSIISGAGLITCVVSTVLDYWYLLSVNSAGDSVKVYFGLWELCGVKNNLKQCVTWSAVKSLSVDDTTWLIACRAFMIMASLALALGVILGFLFSAQYKSSTLMRNVAGALCLVAGICALIAVAVFSAEFNDSLSEEQSGGHLHVGFGAAVVTVILAIAGGIMMLLNKMAFTSSYP